MDMPNHGARKYTFAELVTSSEGRRWTTLSAEVRSHPVSEMPGLVPQDMEVSLAVRGRHDGWVLRSGAGERQRTRPLPGTLWLSPIGIADTDIHVTRPLMRILHLYLPASRFQVLAEEHHLPASSAHSIHYVAGFQDQLIRELGMAVLGELECETSAGRMLVETCSLMLAARLAHRYGDGWSLQVTPPSTRKLDEVRLRRVKDYVLDHIEDDLSVAQLAAVANLSVFHFTRLFSAATGLPPHRYVSHQRLERAMTLLATGRMRLSEIALCCRFSSQASFNRAFRAAVGMTPGQYRRLFVSQSEDEPA
ncbi:AraC family transcriptional regulator [Luteibacter aegosomatissinici]|uniref:AraC family transcriptional regulator n=1 Tax=Luteibacter aegosomatissinici TaxID=2911539 RepID=UPI001FFAC891|nr:AraC family transcriptional regulator [Luteibacter aegosomatissinici]UPG92785.1 AraC family transcriptional regulator [Luteibacter aegosomatissinici]